MPLNYKWLMESYQHDSTQAAGMLRESLASGDLKPKDFDLGRLFTECFGWHNFQECRARRQLANDIMEQALSEAGPGAVSSNMFQNITGQVIFSEIIAAYMSEEFVFTRLIPEMPSEFLQAEKMAGITDQGDLDLVVNEGDPFPLVGVSENWIHAGPASKRGRIVPVTREAIFSDRTGILLERCAKVGYWLGVNREKRAIDCVIDENTPAKSAMLGGHRYHWRDTSIATYNDNTGTHTWDNLDATNALVDWKNLDTSDQGFNAITDPDTGEPIMIEPSALICAKSLEKTALRIRNATEIRVTTPGYATSGNPTQTLVKNPYASSFEVVTSRLLASRMAVKTSWYYGDPKRAFRCKVVFPLQTLEAPANSQDEFTRDIVRQFRADEASVYVTVDPRYMRKNTVA